MADHFLFAHDVVAAYFGDTSFSKKYLPKIPTEIVGRSNAFGISRYRVTEEYLP